MQMKQKYKFGPVVTGPGRFRYESVMSDICSQHFKWIRCDFTLKRYKVVVEILTLDSGSCEILLEIK